MEDSLGAWKTGQLSRAESQTVMTRSTSSSAYWSTWSDVWPEMSIPTSSITRTAIGCTPLGLVPALLTSTRFPPRPHSHPWAICDRARLPVQTTRSRDVRGLVIWQYQSCCSCCGRSDCDAKRAEFRLYSASAVLDCNSGCGHSLDDAGFLKVLQFYDAQAQLLAIDLLVVFAQSRSGGTALHWICSVHEESRPGVEHRAVDGMVYFD